MGVKHGREYEQILNELAEAVGRIPDSYEFFEMDALDWDKLDPVGRQEVNEALAEDLFYALGTEPVITVGSGVVIYESEQHRIYVLIGEEELTSVPLI
ncbi:hypothetical protein [Paenibacillus sp. 1-18]|uniref:hypothetical protein n=1 Tax=Paenibacillus sp. 1-18 TaxID=1333846 RepID=UPI0004708E99|nr:hypothetical protein [Paenibacillus sp. 1-18]